METSHDRGPTRLALLPTQVPGLDRVLRGGVPRGTVLLVAGAPGTGKTTLGNQLAFRHAAAGATALIVTLMAETHDRMLTHMADFSFFDPALMPDRVRVLNALSAPDDSPQALPERLRHMVREASATLLIVDGTAVIDDLNTSRLDFRQLTNQLQAQSALLGCTTVFLLNRDPDELGHIATHADGLIDLRQETSGSRRVRTLEVVKLRGVDHLGGRHEFAIGEDGIEVYPRLEAALAGSPPAVESMSDRLGFGVPGLDAMLGGGLLPGSATLLMGSPGAGKTLTSLHFLLEGAQRGEPGLMASFQESPERLIRTAAGIGLDLATPVRDGTVRLLWRQPLEVSPDAWAWELLTAVTDHRPRRVVVDALTDLERRLPGPDRPPDYVAALVHALREAGATGLLTAELGTLVGPELRVPLPAVSAALDNLLLLRYAEVSGHLTRFVSVFKMRETAFDPAIRRFAMSDEGITVGDVFSRAVGLLTGIPIPESGWSER